MAVLTFLGGAGTVTGSKYLVDTGARRVLVDCGLFQGPKELRLKNWDAPGVDPASVACVLLTHAHIDHTGYLPRFVTTGFDGPVHATSATADLARLLLPDAGHLQEEEAAWHNAHGTSRHRPARPLYTAADGAAAAAKVRAVGYETPVAAAPGIAATWRRAGHILGSAHVALDLTDGGPPSRIVFSGDVGRYGAPILPDPAPLGAADYLLVESTYGDRRHADHEPVADQLEREIDRAVARRGTVLVPAFAVGRTQDLLYHLGTLEQAGRIPALPVFVDSPLAVDATAIYATHPEDVDEEMHARIRRGDFPLRPRHLALARSVAESRAINAVKGPAVVIASSGMATGGRVLHHLRRLLPDARATVLLVGYQAIGTRGRQIQDGARTVRIFQEDVPVAAHVVTIHGLSAHADADDLMRWLRTAERPPRRTFVIHGDPEPARTFADRVRAELGWNVAVPAHGESVTLA